MAEQRGQQLAAGLLAGDDDEDDDDEEDEEDLTSQAEETERESKQEEGNEQFPSIEEILSWVREAVSARANPQKSEQAPVGDGADSKAGETDERAANRGRCEVRRRSRSDARCRLHNRPSENG
jgi:hypothetical protein